MAANPAYLDALRMLARRELSERQVRQRLGRREHPADQIDDAIERLKTDRAIDDARVATVIARTETTIRKRGKLRVKRRIEAAGIAPAVAAGAVDDVFRDVDPDALLNAALQKRLRGAERITDDRQYARLWRYLLRQGFEADRVAALLRKYR
jgi:regulatory protein